MISATIRRDGHALRLQWSAPRGLTLNGAELVDGVAAIFDGQAVPFYSPAKGGWYRGFDSTDPDEVRDALTFLKRQGYTVEDVVDTAPPPPRLPLASPNGLDFTDERVVRHYAELQEAEPLRKAGRNVFTPAHKRETAVTTEPDDTPDRPEPQGPPRKPSILHVHAALVDAAAKAHADRMENTHNQLLSRAERSTSPLERATLRKHAYRVHEAAGALRYSAVTGTDDSEL